MSGPAAPYLPTRWVPLCWAAIAAVAQLGFVFLLAPRLPASFLVWFNADQAGPGNKYYRFGTDDFVTVGWVFVAVIALAGVVCAIFATPDTGWALITALVVCVVVPLLIGLFYGSVIWQLGLSEPATEIPSGIGLIALAIGIVGIFAGLASVFLRPGRDRTA